MFIKKLFYEIMKYGRAPGARFSQNHKMITKSS